MRSTYFLLSILATCSNAFTVPFQANTMRAAPLNAVMTPQELEAILMKGHECEEGGCSVDSVESLIAELQEQQKILSDRIKKVDGMILSMKTLNNASDRNVDEVRETVRSIFRIFAMGAKASGNDYPSLSKPTGYSGEVGTGPTDAYKALNPKPWKPAA